ncbi:MAG: carbohydrate ABC transporter permease [Chloroflexi bacterium]|nr:carbohydrate ABC transporter permease [Chloroflexota bacterium]
MSEKNLELNLLTSARRAPQPRSAFLSRKTLLEILRQLILYIILIAGALPFLFPLIFMLSTSLKSKGEVLLVPIRWIPSQIIWGNYYEAMFGYLPLYWFMLNTLKVVLGSLVGDVLVCALVGYAFARLRAPGRDILFIIVLSTMMLPGQVVLVPTYILFRYLHLLNSLWSLILPNLLAGGAFFIFLFRQFFQTINPELGDAAKIDGCGLFGVFWRIYLPLSTPVLATVAIFSFFWNWNNFLWPLILIDAQDKFVLAVGLKLFQGAHTTEFPLLMAASVIALLPCLLLFFSAQKYFIQGVVVSGVKG